MRAVYEPPRSFPIPLLVEHDFLSAVGLVHTLTEVGDTLTFEAVFNADSRKWTADPWECVICGALRGVSVGTAEGLAPYRFTVTELSLTQTPADHGARVDHALTREQFTYLYGRPNTKTLYESERRAWALRLARL